MSVNRASAQAAVEADRRRCDADETQDASLASSDSTSNDGSDGSDASNDVPPPDFIADPEPEDQIRAPPIPIYQPTVSTKEVHLTVGQFKHCRADLVLHAFTVQHDLTQASIADLLQLSSSAATYCTPHLRSVSSMQASLGDKDSRLLRPRVRGLHPYARVTDHVRRLRSTALQSQRQAGQTGHVLVLDILVGSSSQRPHNWEVNDGEHACGAQGCG